MSTPQETRFITYRTINKMSENYEDISGDFLNSTGLAGGTGLGGALGMWFQEAERMYSRVQKGCQDALSDGVKASDGISAALVTCARNWRAAEEAGMVDHR
ncbi:hypothetical protein [Nonomuraea sp. NPDC005650]|uniref:hypothetical protein n=1 Tax=Nonomuraea sp. NPDC005650 TaxID=3157045 RepID=UPI0033A23F48